MADVLAETRSIIDAYSAAVAAVLGIPTRHVNIRMAPRATSGDGAAATAPAYYTPTNNTIYIRKGWDDPLVLVHELTHAYTLTKHTLAAEADSSETYNPNDPKWLDEGIAEWVKNRLFGTTQTSATEQSVGDPTSASQGIRKGAAPGEVVELKGSPAQGYEPAAETIQYLEDSHPGAVQWLARSLASGTYSDQAFQQQFGIDPTTAMETARPRSRGHSGTQEDIYGAAFQSTSASDAAIRAQSADRAGQLDTGPAQAEQATAPPPALLGYYHLFNGQGQNLSPHIKDAALAVYNHMKYLYQRPEGGFFPEAQGYSYPQYVHDVALASAAHTLNQPQQRVVANRPEPMQKKVGPQ